MNYLVTASGSVTREVTGEALQMALRRSFSDTTIDLFLIKLSDGAARELTTPQGINVRIQQA